MKMGNDVFEQALKAEGITGSLANLARSIYAQESSSGKNAGVSNAGAVGGMQILPGTFKGVADKGWDINNPVHNARAGIRYLGQMNKLAKGDPALAAAGYYGGPGGLAKARQGIAVSDPRNPKAPTTLQYGQQVAARLPGAKAPKAVATAAPPVSVVPEKSVMAPRSVSIPMVEAAPGYVQPAAPAAPSQWQEFVQAIPSAQATAPVGTADFADWTGQEQPTTMPNLDFGSYLPAMQGYGQVNFKPFAGFKRNPL